jgi:hypothetical protein
VIWFKRSLVKGNSRLVCTVALLAGTALAQAGKAPSVTMAPVPLVTAPRVTQTMVDLNFRVARGFHVNSNAPKSEFLIPTALKLDLPTDIILGKIEYPAGQDLSFPFSPDETLNVYSGDFTISLAVHPLHSVVPGKYVMHGVLRYQACDNAGHVRGRVTTVEMLRLQTTIASRRSFSAQHDRGKTRLEKQRLNPCAASRWPAPESFPQTAAYRKSS